MEQDKKLLIPEPPPGIGSGLLTEIWRSDSELPRVRGANLAWYYFRRGIDTVISLPMSSVISVITMAISLFLFAGFLLLLQNAENIIADVGGTLSLTAYFKEGVVEQEVNDFIRELEASRWARSVNFTSKQQALDLFREELGSRGTFLSGLENDNPLPASVDVSLQPDELQIGGLEQFIEKLRTNPLIEEVIYGTEWVEQTKKIVRSFRFVGLVLLFIVLVVIVFLIANTIKLVIYARRDEIGIMQLVGATESFVRIPFVIGGMVQGALGAILGLVLLRLGFSLLTYEFQYSTLLGVTLPQIAFLSPFSMIVIFVLSLGIGAVGSFFALGRFMDV